MRTKTTFLTLLAIQFGWAANLMASTGAREDNSMLLVYLFLGMCALIVIMQLLPAMFLLLGMVKSLFSGNRGQVKANAGGRK